MMGEWTEKKFEELCEVIYRYPNYYGITYVEDGVPEIRGELINPDGSIVVDKQKIRYISKETADKFPKTRLKTNDVVMSVRGTIGKIGIIPEEFEGANMTANLLRISPSTNVVDTGYFKQLLLSTRFQLMLDSITTATTIKTFKVPDLKSLKLKLPSSLNEQQKIAAILSSVDEAIEKTEQIIEQTEKVKKGLMQELLTKGIGHTEFKDSPFGKIPVNWTTNLISDIAIVNPEQLNSKTSDDYTVNYIDISSIENHKISDISVYDFKNAPSRARRILKTNDIIVSTVRPYLRGFAYIQECYNNFICSTGFSVIRCESNCLSNYLFHVILSDKFINYLISNMTGTSFPAVKADDIKNFNFPLPPLDEQKEIANILDQYKTKVSIERRKMTKLKLIKQGLMQELLTGKKRVKVDDSEEVLS